MRVHRRQVLVGTPLTAVAAISAVEAAQANVIDLDVNRIAKRLRVGEAAVEGVVTRLERFLPQPAAIFAGTDDASGGYRLETPVFQGAGRWRFEGAGADHPELTRAIAIGCRGAGAGSEGGLRLRWVAGCAFGGLTLLVYKARRATVGLIVPGHHYGWPPRGLQIGP